MTEQSARIAASIEGYRQAAIAYVWGRDDAGEEIPDSSNVAWHFGQAYAAHRERYERGQSFWAANLRDCWEVWEAFGEIPTDHVAFDAARQRIIVARQTERTA